MTHLIRMFCVFVVALTLSAACGDDNTGTSTSSDVGDAGTLDVNFGDGTASDGAASDGTASDSTADLNYEVDPPPTAVVNDACTEFCDDIARECDGLSFGDQSCAAECSEAAAQDIAWLGKYQCLGWSCESACISDEPLPASDFCVSWCHDIDVCDLYDELEFPPYESLCRTACTAAEIGSQISEEIADCFAGALNSTTCDTDAMVACFAKDIDEVCWDMCEHGEDCSDSSGFGTAFGSEAGCYEHCTSLPDVTQAYALGACINIAGCRDADQCEVLDPPSTDCDLGCRAMGELCGEDGLETRGRRIPECTGYCGALENLAPTFDGSELVECIEDMDSCPADRSSTDIESLDAIRSCGITVSDACIEACADPIVACLGPDTYPASECQADCARGEALDPEQTAATFTCIEESGDTCIERLQCIEGVRTEFSRECDTLCRAQQECERVEDLDACRQACVDNLQEGNGDVLANIACVHYVNESSQADCGYLEDCDGQLETDGYCLELCGEADACSDWSAFMEPDQACARTCTGIVNAARRGNQYDFAACVTGTLNDLCFPTNLQSCFER